jgi:hypothetical protein
MKSDAAKQLSASFCTSGNTVTLVGATVGVNLKQKSGDKQE